MRRLVWAPLVLLVGMVAGCLHGCHYGQHGNSEWGVKHTSTWAFYQDTEKASEDQKASFDADFKPLVEHVLDLRPDDANPTGGDD